MPRILSALIWLMLCAPALAPAWAITGNAPSALIGGRHEVLIVGSHGTSCTGTAIARDPVLTAGHCIEPDTTFKVVESDTARQPQLLGAREVARHPQFDLKTLFAHHATADVALLKMSRPLPADVIPATLGNGTATPQVDKTLTVVGYGVAMRSDGKTGGTLRPARLSVTGKPGNLQIRLVDPATGGTHEGLGACTGDSGAPVFAGTALVGVVNRCSRAGHDPACGFRFSAHTRLDEPRRRGHIRRPVTAADFKSARLWCLLVAAFGRRRLSRRSLIAVIILIRDQNPSFESVHSSHSKRPRPILTNGGFLRRTWSLSTREYTNSVPFAPRPYS
jgi:hypothetical protein